MGWEGNPLGPGRERCLWGLLHLLGQVASQAFGFQPGRGSPACSCWPWAPRRTTAAAPAAGSAPRLLVVKQGLV